MALRFIKQNIKNFGGDPENITIFGESAGAGSVHYHTISEHSRGLFNRAIPMSGCALNTNWTVYPRRDWGGRVAKLIGWNGKGGEKGILEFLETADIYAIAEAAEKILTPEVRGR